MSKINQIEKALQELSGGDFQKLADAYLYKKGYQHINSLGSVIGANKVRKGTPDTLIPLSNGKYVFVEHTTESESRLFKKLKGDLEKCFDETKTGISINHIEEIVFCHTSLLDSDQEQILFEECRKRGVSLNIFGLSAIAYDLYLKYPDLAKEFLQVSVDTGQIVPPDAFVKAYNKNALATPLDTVFRFREEEVKRILNHLSESDLVIISGRPGVGKSRLALECCAQFKAHHPEYTIRCIFNRGIDLFEDLRTYFSDSGNYLIFVDDANRVSGFDYILPLLYEQTDEKKIKIMATVRDYALDRIRETVRPYGGGFEGQIRELEDKQIKQLVEEEFDIRNYLYLDRIADIAHGNPRLAIMAAQIARKENRLESIYDVSALYHEYFSSIRKYLEDPGDRGLLKTAGIVSFFRIVDRTNEKMVNLIEQVFEMPIDAFWENACRLHDLEILDRYENEVVKITDQVLSTYLFYVVFIKEKIISFSILLEHLFPEHRNRLMGSLNPVFTAFDQQEIVDAIRPSVYHTWQNCRDAGDESKLLHLMDAFWFINETDTLVYVRDKISQMESQTIDINQLKFKPESNYSSPSLLSILSNFRYSGESSFRIAVNLLMNYGKKQPRELPFVCHILSDTFGFKPKSYLSRFIFQSIVIEELWKQTQEGQNELYSKLFLAIAQNYLHTHFHTIEPQIGSAFSLVNYQLPALDELFDLRRIIWQHLFQLYKRPSLAEAVIELLEHYSSSGLQVSDRKIMNKDAEQLIPFIQSHLNPANYHHCLIVQHYLDHLEWCKVSFPETIRHEYKNETYKFSELLLEDWGEKKALEMEGDAYWDFKKKNIREHFDNYDFEGYKRLFEHCLIIQKELKGKRFQLTRGIVQVFDDLADRDPNLYIKAWEYYLKLGNPLEISSLVPIRRLIDVCGNDKAYEIIDQPDYQWKNCWLFAYLQSLPTDKITPDHLERLYSLYREAEPIELPSNMDFLLNYQPLNDRIVAHVTKIIIERTEKDSRFGRELSSLFRSTKKIHKALKSHFEKDIVLLKKAYLINEENNRYEDHHGETFALILDLDPGFIQDYIEKMYVEKDWSSRHDDTRDYAFIWRRENYESLVTGVIEQLYHLGQRRMGFGDTFLEAVFRIHESNKDHIELRKKQDQLLAKIIEKRSGDSDFMAFIFELICQFTPKRYQALIEIFLKHNTRIDDFKKLALEPRVWSWTGSAVPVIQKRIDFYESLLPLLNSIEFLDHKQYLNRRIQGLREYMESEKKKDFIRD